MFRHGRTKDAVHEIWGRNNLMNNICKISIPMCSGQGFQLLRQACFMFWLIEKNKTLARWVARLKLKASLAGVYDPLKVLGSLHWVRHVAIPMQREAAPRTIDQRAPGFTWMVQDFLVLLRTQSPDRVSLSTGRCHQGVAKRNKLIFVLLSKRAGFGWFSTAEYTPVDNLATPKALLTGLLPNTHLLKQLSGSTQLWIHLFQNANWPKLIHSHVLGRFLNMFRCMESG